MKCKGERGTDNGEEPVNLKKEEQKKKKGWGRTANSGEAASEPIGALRPEVYRGRGGKERHKSEDVQRISSCAEGKKK